MHRQLGTEVAEQAEVGLLEGGELAAEKCHHLATAVVDHTLELGIALLGSEGADGIAHLAEDVLLLLLVEGVLVVGYA